MANSRRLKLVAVMPEMVNGARARASRGWYTTEDKDGKGLKEIAR